MRLILWYLWSAGTEQTDQDLSVCDVYMTSLLNLLNGSYRHGVMTSEVHWLFGGPFLAADGMKLSICLSVRRLTSTSNIFWLLLRFKFEKALQSGHTRFFCGFLFVLYDCSKVPHIQSFAQFRTFAQFRIIQIEEYLILLNDSAGEFKLLSEKVHSLTEYFHIKFIVLCLADRKQVLN